MFKVRYKKRYFGKRDVVKHILNGAFHRLDGPAVEHTCGDKYWMVNGMLHRLDGPACEYGDGNKEWYINDNEYSENQWTQLSRIYLDRIRKYRECLK